MKIKNEYVKIRTGKKTFTFKNMILNKYLEALAKSQVSGTDRNRPPFLNNCYLKFSRKLIFDEDTELHKKDFDKKCTGEIINQESNSKEVITTYLYNTDDFSSYIDKEITAIGFFEEGIDECYACLDMYGLGFTITDYFNFYIERKDIASIDAEFTDKNGEQAPTNINKILHLAPGPQTVEGKTVQSRFLTQILFGDETEANITQPVNPLVIDETKLIDGIIEITNTFTNTNNYTYAWFVYTAMLFDPTTQTGSSRVYYLKKPIENFEDFKFTITLERDNN